MENIIENNMEKKSFISKLWVQSLVGIILIIASLAVLLYWKSTSSYVAVDMSQISAPIINIGPENAGILSEVYVKPGDKVSAGQALARTGSEILTAKVDGIIINVNNTPGQVFTVSTAGSSIVSMIDPSQLRVVGKIDEDKGLSQIKVGDPASFTVDAFGSEQFTGIVDSISQTADQSSVVFSISDKREIKQFDVKVRYDISAYPEFKNGMSAKLRIYAR